MDAQNEFLSPLSSSGYNSLSANFSTDKAILLDFFYLTLKSFYARLFYAVGVDVLEGFYVRGYCKSDFP